ncbi:MAG: WG repeat-containing protein [Deltaproteobacteria bacterium]|nr:WG repeat-containing protein [Deltaproteobacteria bacterium]
MKYIHLNFCPFLWLKTFSLVRPLSYFGLITIFILTFSASLAAESKTPSPKKETSKKEGKESPKKSSSPKKPTKNAASAPKKDKAKEAPKKDKKPPAEIPLSKSGPTPLIPLKAQNDLYGYVDYTGRWRIKPRFRAANPFKSDATAFVKLDNDYALIDDRGNVKAVISSFRGRELGAFAKNGLAKATNENQSWGFVNRSGYWAIEARFQEAKDFGQSDLAPVKMNGRWGAIDKAGRFQLEPRYQSIESFAPNGLAKASMESGKWGFLDRKGRWAIKPTFWSEISVWSFAANGLAGAQGDDHLWGYIDSSGQWAIEPSFKYARSFSTDGLAAVQGDNFLWGFIDQSGHWVVTPEFSEAGGIIDKGDLLAVKNDDDLWGFIDQSGRYVIKPRFKAAKNFTDNDLAPVSLDNFNWGLVDKKGDFVVKPMFDSPPLARGDGLVEGKNKGSQETLYFNSQGEARVPFGYEQSLEWNWETNSPTKSGQGPLPLSPPLTLPKPTPRLNDQKLDEASQKEALFDDNPPRDIFAPYNASTLEPSPFDLE